MPLFLIALVKSELGDEVRPHATGHAVADADVADASNLIKFSSSLG